MCARNLLNDRTGKRTSEFGNNGANFTMYRVINAEFQFKKREEKSFSNKRFSQHCIKNFTFFYFKYYNFVKT